ncbi:hypothetical protein EH11_04114 [Bacillus subtilis]|nr:hypothetical protein ABP1_1306 [Bacillus subtilis]RPJ98565.1 hypothetical protein EH11_04114 [Bacillus subtilis]RUS04121.1 hypothetical protein EFW59_04117 [Bacillus subtilis]
MSPPNEAPIIPLDCGSLVTFQFSSISGMNWFVCQTHSLMELAFYYLRDRIP